MSSLASERKEKYKQLCLAGPGVRGHSPQGDQGRPMLAFGSMTVTPWSPPSTAIGGWGWPRNARATKGQESPRPPLPVCRGACPVVLTHRREGM